MNAPQSAIPDSEESAAVYTFTADGPQLADPYCSEEQGFRTLGGLAAVTAVPVSESESTVQYWTFGDVSDGADRTARARLPVQYDLTFLADRPIGWESPKTHGHVHVSATHPGAGFPELYEVLEGEAALLVQDLLPGPAATFVALIEAEPGQMVAVPPGLYHSSINRGTSMAVLADVIAREAADEYESLQAARGMAYYIDIDGEAVANPAYSEVPPLLRMRAEEWIEQSFDPLYEWVVSDGGDTGWLCDEATFWSRYPQLQREGGRID